MIPADELWRIKINSMFDKQAQAALAITIQAATSGQPVC